MDILSYRKNPRHQPPTLQRFFPNKTEVFAAWFTGDIRLETGKILKSFGRAGNLYEKHIFLSFENGILINTTVINNQ
jgi:hypothetical protein